MLGRPPTVDHARRLAGFALAAVEANLRDPPLPYRLFLYVTDACNCRCTMCHIWQKPTDGELTTEELLAVLRGASRHVRWMDVTGGEVFLRKDVPELFGYIAQMPGLLMFHFATNGLLTERIVAAARQIRESPIPQFIVTVSLDGPPELHERIRGIPRIWSRCMATFQALRAEGVQTVLGMTLTEHNAEAYEATFDAVRAEVPGVTHEDFHVNIGHVSDVYYANRGLIDPPMERLAEAVERIHRLRGFRLHPVNWLERQYLAHVHGFARHGLTPMPCEALSSSAVLGTRGDVYPCIIYDRPVGNVRDHGLSLERVWRAGLREHVRDEIRQGRCPQCWTPCEAYQAILANALPLGKNKHRTWQPVGLAPARSAP